MRRLLILTFLMILLITPLSCGGGGGTAVAEPASAATGTSEPCADTGACATQPVQEGGAQQTAEPDSTETHSAAADPFLLVVIPDSQHTTVSFPEIFDAQMQWIADNIETRNIAFVLHEGDVTHYNDQTGWANASASYERIDGLVPHTLAVGNHDMDFPATYDTTLMDTYFPASRYQGYGYFGGSYPQGTLNNSYHTFSAGDADWLVMSIRYAATDDILDWANSVADAHQDRRIIVITHAFVQPDGTIGRDASGLWENFVSQHSNIELVFNGHYTDGETGRASFTGDNGNTIQALFANYQKNPYGGWGYMRLVTVDPAGGALNVQTYSPWLDQFLTDSENQFTITWDIDG